MLKFLQRSLCAALLLLFSAGRVRAERDVGFKYVAYSDNNMTNVTTEGLDASIDLTPKTKLTMTRIVDGISGASRKIPILDGITGATAHVTPDHIEYRREISAGIAQKIKNNTFSITGDHSGEDDYSSVSYFLSWTTEFDNRNQALSLSYSNFNDKLFPFGVAWTDTRLSKIYDLAYTRVLTPSTEMRIVGSFARDDGYLGNPYHRIPINDFYYMERHPAVRDKEAFGLFYNVAIEGILLSSIQFDYRYYYDNWGVLSNTLGVKYNRYLTDTLMVSLRARYYAQGAASFYKNVYTQEELYMTDDQKLAAFSAGLYGAGVQYEVLPGLTIDIMFEQYDQSSYINYDHVYNSVSKSDLMAQILYLSLHMKM
ncbi:MAG: DUF3570 domain-containing protein [Elusimicrobia bacterium]|nr:DUF3570 domain-containing protein [Elusimicrobiota bacterium]